MKNTLRTLWVVLLALGLGFAVSAQQQVNNFTVKTNLSVGGNVQTVTLNGYNVDAIVTNSAASVATVFAENLQSLLSEASPSVAKLAYVLNDDSSGDATRGTYRYDPTLTGPETATVFMAQDKLGNTASTGRWVRMSAGDNYQMSVDTLDDALAVSPAYLAAGINPTNSIKLTVKTRARKTLGKGGAASYYYSATAPGATNAGTIVPYGSGYLLWDGEGQVTPQMFGAKGDASSDDAAAIQAAINYLAALTNAAGIKVGGTLYFPPGVYYIRSAISMKPRVNFLGPGKNRSEQYQQTGSITGLGSGGAASLLPDPSNTTAIETLVFDGETSTELPTKGSGTSFLNGEDGEMFPFYSTIDGMNIYGTLATGGGRKSAIRIWRAMFVTVKNCSVMQARGNLIYAYGCLGLRLQDNTLINYHGRNTFIFALSDGFLLNNQFEAGLGYNLWAQMNHNAAVGNSFPNPHEDLYVGSLDGAATNAFTSFTADASTDLITATLNGAPLTTMTVGDPVFFHANSGTLPGGLSENVAYFVSTVDTTAGTFSVSSRITETSGGTGGAWEGNKLNITSAGSGNWSVSQAAESNLLLYNCNGNSITGGRIDFTVRDGLRVIAGSYPAVSGLEISSVGRMQNLRAIATRTNTIAGLHLMTTTSEGSFEGAISMSAFGTGRVGVWLDGTGLYRNRVNFTYNNCATNVWNTSDATANTVDYLDQGGGTILWKAPATVSGPWTFNSPPLMQNSTAGAVGAVVKGQEATSVLDIYGAGTTAGLGPRVNFYRSRGTLDSPTQTQTGDTVVPLIAQALDNTSTYRAVGEIQINAENNVTSSAFGGSVVLRAVPIGAATTRQNFLYGLSRGVAISDSTAGYPDNTTVLDLVSTTRGLGLPSMTADVSSPRDGVIWYRSDTDVVKVRANGATVDVVSTPSTSPSTGQILVYTNSTWAAMTPGASGIGGSTGSVDNRVLRADGTGGSTAQNSAVLIDDYTSSTANNVAIRVDDGSTANISAVVTPKGTGAFIVGPKPDGTGTGGNARGQYAVDLQPWRDFAGAVASGNSSVAVGTRNTASALYSVAIGFNCWGAAQGAVAVGEGNTASGLNSFASGSTSTASGAYSFAHGFFAQSPNRGQFSISGGNGGSSGGSQSCIATVYRNTTATTQVVLATDGSSGTLALPNNTAWTFEAKVTGITSAAATVYSYILTGVITRGANAASTAMPAAVTKVVIFESNAAADADAVADTTNGALSIRVTPFDTTATRWSATVQFNQVTF